MTVLSRCGVEIYAHLRLKAQYEVKGLLAGGSVNAVINPILCCGKQAGPIVLIII